MWVDAVHGADVDECGTKQEYACASISYASALQQSCDDVSLVLTSSGVFTGPKNTFLIAMNASSFSLRGTQDRAKIDCSSKTIASPDAYSVCFTVYEGSFHMENIDVTSSSVSEEDSATFFPQVCDCKNSLSVHNVLVHDWKYWRTLEHSLFNVDSFDSATTIALNVSNVNFERVAINGTLFSAFAQVSDLDTHVQSLSLVQCQVNTVLYLASLPFADGSTIEDVHISDSDVIRLFQESTLASPKLYNRTVTLHNVFLIDSTLGTQYNGDYFCRLVFGGHLDLSGITVQRCTAYQPLFYFDSISIGDIEGDQFLHVSNVNINDLEFARPMSVFEIFEMVQVHMQFLDIDVHNMFNGQLIYAYNVLTLDEPCVPPSDSPPQFDVDRITIKNVTTRLSSPVVALIQLTSSQQQLVRVNALHASQLDTDVPLLSIYAYDDAPVIVNDVRVDNAHFNNHSSQSLIYLDSTSYIPNLPSPQFQVTNMHLTHTTGFCAPLQIAIAFATASVTNSSFVSNTGYSSGGILVSGVNSNSQLLVSDCRFANLSATQSPVERGQSSIYCESTLLNGDNAHPIVHIDSSSFSTHNPLGQVGKPLNCRFKCAKSVDPHTCIYDSDDDNDELYIIIGSVVGGLALILIVSLGIFFYRRNRTHHGGYEMVQ
jgi:hypothetical protein